MKSISEIRKEAKEYFTKEAERERVFRKQFVDRLPPVYKSKKEGDYIRDRRSRYCEGLYHLIDVVCDDCTTQLVIDESQAYASLPIKYGAFCLACGQSYYISEIDLKYMSEKCKL